MDIDEVGVIKELPIDYIIKQAERKIAVIAETRKRKIAEFFIKHEKVPEKRFLGFVVQKARTLTKDELRKGDDSWRLQIAENYAIPREQRLRDLVAIAKAAQNSNMKTMKVYGRSLMDLEI